VPQERDAREDLTGLVVFGWSYFILTGSISQIWPMFGIANQLLAAVALCVGTSVIVNAGRARYAWTTVVPLAFVATTTLYAGYLSITKNFLPLATFAGYLDAVLTSILMACVLLILALSARAWMHGRMHVVPLPAGPDHRHVPGTGCC
jgi:carbon starvation protein